MIALAAVVSLAFMALAVTVPDAASVIAWPVVGAAAIGVIAYEYRSHHG